jgi:flagellin
MPQIINTNIASLTAQRNLNTSQSSLQTALQRLSSGLRINSAKDDAAGLAISQRFTAQINGLDQAQRNANDGVSLAQTAEGALGQMGDLLQRIRQLAVQSANATNTASDRQAINQEVGQLTSELQRFSQTTQFNGQNILDGSFGSAAYQVGANAGQTITATTANFQTSKYGAYQLGGTSYGGFAVVGTSATTAASGALITASGTLNISSSAGSGAVAVGTGDSAQTIASNINTNAAAAGVTATAFTQATFSFAASGSYTLQVMGDNSTAQTVSFQLTSASDVSAAVDAFNQASSKTGITAKVDTTGSKLVLTAADGANVVLGVAATGDIAGAVKKEGTNTVSLSSSGNITVGGQVLINSASSYSVAASGATFTAGLFGVASGATMTSSLQSVSSLDVTTVDNANQAIRIVDAALTAINNQRAAFGALQNRFSAAISNLQVTSENLSSARSRIQDADFAQETSNMTRSQILQQAGTAMLAQANALPNNVLTLLK